MRIALNAYRKLTRLYVNLQAPLLARKLERTNLSSRKSILGSSDVIVSLTTHGTRLDNVHLTIESIANGEIQPKRVLLWLDRPEVMEELPASLVRLQQRGLEILLTNNYGPHTKYYPLVNSLKEPTRFVTADDDILYPKGWLKSLIAESDRTPDMIICNRAHYIIGDPLTKVFRGYGDWEQCWTDKPDPRVFFTGVSGVIYPAIMVNLLKNRDQEFLESCPRADDVWLNRVAFENHVIPRQASRIPRHYAVIPGSQEQALMLDNVHNSQNDIQIRATYSDELMRTIMNLPYGN